MTYRSFHIQRLALPLFSLVLALILQSWVGNFSLYSKWSRGKHLLLHEAILNGAPPQGQSWKEFGARGMNIRVLVIHLADTVQQNTDWTLDSIYWHLDLLCLTFVFILLYKFLRRWMEPEYSLIGILYYFVVAVLSYHFHYFHPYDRLTQVWWLLILFLVRGNRPLALGAILIPALATKADMLFVPLLYFMVRFNRESLRQLFIKTGLLFVVTFGTYQFLWLWWPEASPNNGGASIASFAALMSKNFDQFVELGATYPPLLALAFPVLLSILDFKHKDRFLQAMTAFALIMLLPHILFSHFREVRAIMYVFPLLLPSALWSLRKILNGSAPILEKNSV